MMAKLGLIALNTINNQRYSAFMPRSSSGFLIAVDALHLGPNYAPSLSAKNLPPSISQSSLTFPPLAAMPCVLLICLDKRCQQSDRLTQCLFSLIY
jgi:hypothetical protein